MNIEKEKSLIGESNWASNIKWAQKRAEADDTTTRDIGVLWAADRIKSLRERVAELEEDVRVANDSLELVERWQDKLTEVYPVVAEHITKLLLEPLQGEQKDG